LEKQQSVSVLSPECYFNIAYISIVYGWGVQGFWEGDTYTSMCLQCVQDMQMAVGLGIRRTHKIKTL
jgi:hypothetical protein